MRQVLITRSQFIKSNEYYVFRPIGNEQYMEMPFQIIDGVIIQYPNKRLKWVEMEHIKKYFL